MINTCENEMYNVTIYFSPRPGHPENEIDVYWNGSFIIGTTADGTGLDNTSWGWLRFNAYGAAGSDYTELSILETGTPDGKGMLIDNVTVVFSTP
jgi:hypothetical protein